jgi:hypothetical protein
MNQRNKPSDIAPAFPKVPRYIKTPHHPVGLLYTLLHHGRGLSVEEAQRRSLEYISDRPDKAA